LQATLKKGGGELALIAAQDTFVSPGFLFHPEPLS